MSDCVGDNFIYNDLELPSAKFSDEWMQSGNLVYEVMRVEEGVPLFIEDYLARLEKTIQLSGLKIDFNRKQIYDNFIRLIAINNGFSGPVKLMISENSSVLHYMKPHLPLPEEYFSGVKTIFIREERINPNAKIWNPAFRSKIISALQETGAYEAILVNQNDEITEGSRSNIFFVKGSELYTAHTAAVLPGITRMKVLSACDLTGLKVNEVHLPLNDLGYYDSAFLTGTSRKVLPIRLIDDLAFRADNEVIKIISLTFEELTTGYILKWKSFHNR